MKCYSLIESAWWCLATHISAIWWTARDTEQYTLPKCTIYTEFFETEQHSFAKLLICLKGSVFQTNLCPNQSMPKRRQSLWNAKLFWNPTLTLQKSSWTQTLKYCITQRICIQLWFTCIFFNPLGFKRKNRKPPRVTSCEKKVLDDSSIKLAKSNTCWLLSQEAVEREMASSSGTWNG